MSCDCDRRKLFITDTICILFLSCIDEQVNLKTTGSCELFHNMSHVTMLIFSSMDKHVSL